VPGAVPHEHRAKTLAFHSRLDKKGAYLCGPGGRVEEAIRCDLVPVAAVGRRTLAPATAGDDARSVFDDEVRTVANELGVDAEDLARYRVRLFRRVKADG